MLASILEQKLKVVGLCKGLSEEKTRRRQKRVYFQDSRLEFEDEV